MDESKNLPRHASTRTSLEVVARRVVDQAVIELAAYLDKLPECGTATPTPVVEPPMLIPLETLSIREVETA
jgi:hypothetical protein